MPYFLKKDVNIMEKRPIVLSKIGFDHSFQGMNKQDLGVMFHGVKLSLDGCSSGHFSEVGVSLFAQVLSKREDITVTNFDEIVRGELRGLVDGLHFTDIDMFENFCFTILAVIETEDNFYVFSCGDGYIFAITEDGRLEVSDLDQDYDNMPPYYIYNFISPEHLSAYQDGVGFRIRNFPKSLYADVGVGSDGYRFGRNLCNADQVKFEEALINGKRGRIGQIINRNPQVFKDDITIVL